MILVTKNDDSSLLFGDRNHVILDSIEENRIFSYKLLNDDGVNFKTVFGTTKKEKQ